MATELCEQIEVWSCPEGCGAEYGSAEEAAACCASDAAQLVTVWECRACPQTYETEGEATRCCQTVTPMWKCDDCGEIYGTEEAALECCGATEEPRTEWKCSKCGTTYEEKVDAISCCKGIPSATRYACAYCGASYAEKGKAASCCVSSKLK